ncbi:MAG: hypothetical protein JJU29_19395 [Verrucomicrobia bacterium]|nr:hypothetical protein [Verrucomicrobiota bacterium]MCH8513893.1 PfkB family carbohydrate kinase [Kiritimatiellia bacterium]
MNSLPILCCGPTPALQRTLRFRDWSAPGDVVRTSEVTWSVGGKATNAARAIACGGGQASILSPAGGMNGQRMRELLNAEGLQGIWMETAAETRICQTLLDVNGHRIRELVENAPALRLPEWGEYFSQLERALHFHGAVLLCGSLPENAPVEVYATLTEMAVKAGKKVVIDAKGAPLSAALPHQPDLIKINRDELRDTSGSDDIPEGLRILMDLGAKAVMVTDGPHDAWLAEGRKIHRYTLPEIQPVNPIGGGDTVTGVTALSWICGMKLPKAAIEGLGAGMAQTLTSEPAKFDPATARNLARKIKCR